MTPRRASFVVLGFTALLLAGCFAVRSAEGLWLASAIASAEGRPPLLRDARWGDPGSAKSFQAEFPAGVEEEALLAWLERYRFRVDGSNGKADRVFGTGVCNELVRVAWAASDGRLTKPANVLVTESGCL